MPVLKRINCIYGLRIAAFIFSIFLSPEIFSQDVVFDWVKQLKENNNFTQTYSVGVDDNKNVYAVGIFNASIDLDPGPGVFNITTTPNPEHVFIVKLDPNGNFIWGKIFDGTGSCYPDYLHVTPEGTILLAGRFDRSVDFDPGPGTQIIDSPDLPGGSNQQLYIAKLDTDGNLQWVRTAGGPGADKATGITADTNGNIIATGQIEGPTDFDPGPGTAIVGGYGSGESFTCKYDPLGNLIWAKEMPSNIMSRGWFVKTDPFNNIYLSGQFEGTMDANPGPATYNLGSFGGITTYLVKLNANGEFIWGRNAIIGFQFDVDRLGQVYVFAGTLTKFNSNGNLIWSKTLGGTVTNDPAGRKLVTVDVAGNIYVTGGFNATRDFDPGPAVFNMTAVGGRDAFITRLDANGNFVWAKQFGNFTDENPCAISVDTSGGVYTVGTFNNTVDFDPGPAVFNLTRDNEGGVYVHKMSRCTNVTYSTIDIATCSAYTLNNLTYTSSGTYYQTLQNASGCDSLITLHLDIQTEVKEVAITACDSYTWDNQQLNTSGVYTHRYVSSAGCDSTVKLTLTVKQRSLSNIGRQICEGDQYEGYSISGIYTDIFTAVNGCDSIRTLNLTVIPKKTALITAEICGGETYLGYTQTGTYVDHFVSAQGCDSMRTLQLKVNPAYNTTVNKTICRGENYLGHTTSGVFVDRMQTIAGCDSIQTTTLIVKDLPAQAFSGQTSICKNDSLLLQAGQADSYLWQDGSIKNYFTVKTTGVYSVIASNTCGSTESRITVDVNPCVILFPNAFTPNDDGKNDGFGILNGFNVKDYHLRIYNRWGEVIFESYNPAIKWDGTRAGKKLDIGVFIWQCSFKENNELRNMHGTVTLIR